PTRLRSGKRRCRDPVGPSLPHLWRPVASVARRRSADAAWGNPAGKTVASVVRFRLRNDAAGSAHGRTAKWAACGPFATRRYPGPGDISHFIILYFWLNFNAVRNAVCAAPVV